ncbi:hypothetical protein FB451DRAFT_1490684 [Mycena latifolia]|nr:hypothetical protein FB451DRAFT_1490684 [Mycena latifolia]
MPRQPAITEIRLTNIIACLTPAISLLNELHDTLGTPFVLAISNTTLSLITAVQKVKRNKDECVQLMENIHGVLYAIITLHMKSESGGSLPPTTLDQLGKFTEFDGFRTLHKIHMFVEVQQDGNKIKHFFRQNEISTMLKECHEGMRQALDVFKINSTMFTSIAEMQKIAEIVHQEVLEFISTLSDGTTSDRSSSITAQIFHGRECELRDMVKMFTEESPRIAILGAGGMGKTSLARATLHHPDITTKYEHRVFVACDAANTDTGIASLLGSHLGLKPGKDLVKPVLQCLSRMPSLLLVLDDLENAWEPKESRGGVEEFLSLLAGIKHLALIITMRGAERPAKVRWTRPFLLPLKPLSNVAAWQTFIDIAEDSYKHEDIECLLQLTDNMPLAVDLIAHMVSYEGCANVLSRWKTEKTSLLSNGHDKQSSLDASIALSLSSSRMNSVPGAKHLLSLLSILPDGLSDVELLYSRLAIRDILRCKATLLGTSLAYIDSKQRLRSLVPIREHVLKFHPPSADHIEPLRQHFHLLLNIYQQYHGQIQTTSIEQLNSNFGNIQQILKQELQLNSPHLSDVIEDTILLNSFSRQTGRGWLKLMDIVPNIFPQPCNHRLETQYIMETFHSRIHHPISTPELLVTQAISHLDNLNDPILESRFYTVAGGYYYFSKNDPSAAMDFLEKAFTLARLSGNMKQQSQALNSIADIKWMIGDYLTSWLHACEAQRLAQISANCYDETRALFTEAHCCMSLGDYRQSLTLIGRARELLNLCGLSGGSLDFSIRNMQAEIYLLKSEYTKARHMHTQTLQNTFAEQNPHEYAFCLLSIAEADVKIGACQQNVHQNLDKAKIILNINKSSLETVYCEMILADLHLREGNIVVAKDLLYKCFNASWGRIGEASSYCLERLADVSRWGVNDFHWASRWTVVYLGHAKKTRGKLELYKALQFLGDMLLHTGEEETAHSLFTVALEGFTYMDVHRSKAHCMLQLGDLAHRRGQSVEGAELWRNARPLFELSSQINDVAQINARLSTDTESLEALGPDTLIEPLT